MLEIKIQKKIYPNGYQALGELQLVLPDSGFFAITGDSGSGKSTLLNCIGGTDDFDGELIFNNQVIDKKQIDNYRKNNISTIFQDFRLVQGLNVGQNISLASDIIGKKSTKNDILDLLLQVGLQADYYEKQISELSYGEMQRVAIARAIAKQSEIIIADEPTANLDSQNSKNIMSILKGLSKDRLVLIVSHNTELVEEFCEGYVYLEDGEIIKNTIANQDANTQVAIRKKSSKTNLSLIKTLIKSQNKKFIRYIALSVLTIVFCVISALGITIAKADYTSAFINTLENNPDNEQTVFATINSYHTDIDSYERGFDSDLIGNYTGFSEADIELINTKEFSQYLSKLNDNTIYYGNNIPIINKIIYAETIRGTGFELLYGKKELSQNEIIIPYRIAEIIVLSGKTTEKFVESKQINTYEDIVGLQVSINIGGEPQLYKIAGIYRNPISKFDTYCEFKKMSSKQQGNYSMMVNNLSIDLAMIVSSSNMPDKLNGIVLDYSSDKDDIFDKALTFAGQFKKLEIRYNFFGSAGIVNAVNTLNSVRNITVTLTVIMLAIVALIVYITMSTAIGRSRQQVLILRALGMAKKDIFVVFVVSAILMAIIQIIISVILTAIGIPLLNLIIDSIVYEYTFVLFGLRFIAILIPMLTIFIVNILTAFLSITRLFAKSVESKYREV